MGRPRAVWEKDEDVRSIRRQLKRVLYALDKDRILQQQKARYERDKATILLKQHAYTKRRRAELSQDPEVQRQRAESKVRKQQRMRDVVHVLNAKRWAGHVSIITPERVKMWKDKYASKPESREKKRAYAQRPEVKARRRVMNREKDKRRWRTDPQFALASSLRCRIREALAGRGLTKRHRTEDLIGCTVEEFKASLERQFLPGMSWENRSEWHIDHKRPCASFDLTDVEQQRQCFHHTNMQPLWKLDNLRKGARLLEAA